VKTPLLQFIFLSLIDDKSEHIDGKPYQGISPTRQTIPRQVVMIHLLNEAALLRRGMTFALPDNVIPFHITIRLSSSILQINPSPSAKALSNWESTSRIALISLPLIFCFSYFSRR
jgi:hypothetical protein